MKNIFGISVSINIRVAFFGETMRSFFGVSVSWSIRNFTGVDLFYFERFDWKLLGFISGNIRNVFFRENKRNAFFWENISIFLKLELKRFIPGYIRNFFRVYFISFFGVPDGNCARSNHTIYNFDTKIHCTISQLLFSNHF